MKKNKKSKLSNRKESLKYTGGARIGMMNITWPFAILSVSKYRLDLNASILGKYSFTEDDIISIKEYKSRFLIGSGLKINHAVSSYKNSIIFWSFEDPIKVLDQIKNIGFFRKNNTLTRKVIKEEVKLQQQFFGFPFKISYSLIILSITGLLFLLNETNYDQISYFSNRFGYYSIIAFLFLFLNALLILFVKKLRKLTLKNGRGIDEVKRFLIIILLLCGLLILSVITS